MDRGPAGDGGRPRFLRWLVVVLGVVLTVRFGPVAFSGREAPAYYRGDETKVAYLLHGAGRDLLTLVQPERFYGTKVEAKNRFRTGSARFDGEWFFGTFLMTVVGASQTAIEHPDLAADSGDVTHLGEETLVAPQTRAYDTEAWSEDALDHLEGSSRDHCAYLCNLAFGLGMARLAEPKFAYGELHDRLARPSNDACSPRSRCFSNLHERRIRSTTPCCSGAPSSARRPPAPITTCSSTGKPGAPRSARHRPPRAVDEGRRQPRRSRARLRHRPRLLCALVRAARPLQGSPWTSIARTSG